MEPVRRLVAERVDAADVDDDAGPTEGRAVAAAQGARPQRPRRRERAQGLVKKFVG